MARLTVVEKLRGLLGVHDHDTVRADLDEMVEFDIPIVKAQNTTDVDEVVYSPRTGVELVGCRFVAKEAVAADNTNYVQFTVDCNGVEAVNSNTTAAGTNGITVNTSEALTVNAAAAAVGAGEVVKIEITHAGGANAPNAHGNLVLSFRHVD